MIHTNWGRAGFAIVRRDQEPMWGVGMKMFSMHDCSGLMFFIGKLGVSFWYDGDSWLMRYPTHLAYSYAAKKWFVIATCDRWGFGYWRERNRINFNVLNIQFTMDIE